MHKIGTEPWHIFLKRHAGDPPKPLPHLDTVLLNHIRHDGTYCGRFTPVEGWLRPAHRKARQKGWLRAGSLKLFGDYLWFLTPRGEAAALEAHGRYLARVAKLNEWSARHHEAMDLWKAQHGTDDQRDRRPEAVGDAVGP